MSFVQVRVPVFCATKKETVRSPDSSRGYSLWPIHFAAYSAAAAGAADAAAAARPSTAAIEIRLSTGAKRSGAPPGRVSRRI